jgi:hypothetical protein
MLRTLALVVALSATASAAFSAPALDAKGKCRDNGKFVAASMCAAPAAPAASASSMTSGAHPKKCVKGKACGNTCISVKDTCHK